jgi:hypothetical protein
VKENREREVTQIGLKRVRREEVEERVEQKRGKDTFFKVTGIKSLR